MKRFFRYVVLLACVFGIVPFGMLHASETRVEAEKMKLVNYEVVREGAVEYIRLNGTTGIASFEFSLPSGEYDIDARYLSEKIGQNTYAMYIGENQIIAWLGKNRDDQWHKVSEQKWHAPRRIPIKKGEKIRIESLSNKGSLAILDCIEFTPSLRVSSSTEQDVMTIYPREYAHAIRNPLKGFRSSFNNSSAKDHEYGTLSKTYFRWSDLENAEGDGVDKIIMVCDSVWRGAEAMNHKFIPRVYLQWPGKTGGWSSDMTEGDYTSEQFKRRVIAFIKKLGEAWDNDSRVAYVEMGLIGEWGEMEWPNTTDEIKGMIAAQFATSFENKLVMIRWPNTYNDHMYNFGYYWDSFGHLDQDYYAYHLNKTSPRWRTAVIGGESAYDWGNYLIQPGKSPDVSLSTRIHRNFIIDRVRKLHANHVGWIANYSQDIDSVRAGADVVQRALGYRFVISEVSYPKRIDTDAKFTLSFKVKNTGSSPFYYSWPVEVSLLEPKTKKVVWKQKLKGVDIRNWMPGDRWDDSTDTYTIPAENNLINYRLQVSGVPKGEYTVALAILDPAGDRPCVRFAIENYYNGGRHPIGRVGVNTAIGAFSVADFDDVQRDRSLSYEKVVQ